MTRNFGVLEHQYNLDRASNTRRCIQVTNVGLYRAYYDWLIQSTTFAEHSIERLNLNWIAKNGSGAMSLYIADLRWCHLGIHQCLTNQCLLGLTVRNGQATTTGTTVVHCRAPNKCENAITIGQSRRKTLEDYNSTSLSPAHAIRSFIKRFAATIGCHGSSFG